MSLAVTREIQAIIDMDLTAFGVNLSKVLVSQRESIAELMQIHDKLKAEVAELTANNKRLAGFCLDKLAEPSRHPHEQLPDALVAQGFSLRCNMTDAPSPTPDPINTCAPEKPAEEDGEGEAGIGIEIRVTGEGPMPPGLTAMLNDLTSMLQSVARK